MDETKLTQKRYDRIAPLYNLMDGMMNSSSMLKWRQKLWESVEGSDVLEVGIGTGANLELYPDNLNITAIDFSPKMLALARQKANRLGIPVQLKQMDVQQLEFPDNSFDAVLTSCVFCSVPDANRGLQEIHRVLRPTGKLLMIEHVLSTKAVLRQLMQLVNPLTVRIVGANINRETADSLAKAGFKVKEENIWADILKFFVASPQ